MLRRRLSRALVVGLDFAFAPGFGDLARRTWRLLSAHSRALYYVALLSSFVVIFDLLSAAVFAALVVSSSGEASMTLPVLGELSNPVASLSPETALVSVVLAVLALQLMREVVLYVSRLISGYLAADIECDVRARVAQVLLSTRYSAIVEVKRNDLVIYGAAICSGYAAFVAELVLIASVVMTIALYAASAALADPGPFAVVVPLVGGLILLTNRLVLRQQGLGRQLRDFELNYHDQFQDAVFGLKEITINNQRANFLQRLQDRVDRLRELRRESAYLKVVVTPLQRASAMTLLSLALVVSVLVSESVTSLGSLQGLVFILFLLVRMYGPVAQLNALRSSIMLRTEMARTILGFLESDLVEHAPVSAPAVTGGANGTGALAPSIRFESVSYDYAGATTSALDQLTFCARAGETTAIVGPSGAGKSTVIDLLLKLRKPTSGRILVDEVDLVQTPDADWRGRIAAIHQAGHVFYGTVAENVSMFDQSVTIDAVKEALARAQLDDFVSTLPQGLETRIGGPDTPLSGGQRQRLQIARAFIRKPRLLILDEATSAQDALVEEELLNVVRADFAEATVITVAHRFSSIKHVDQIVVLANGRLEESGAWPELARKEGLFAKLLQKQSLEDATVRVAMMEAGS